ncbi:hypothetical protein [Xanthomonas sp. 3075]|nr:hypothetical protein [Xanthomonas sp. 3075]MBB4132937.1 hypothetical protein [Xanthomonas sp. 3075]
MKVFAIKGLRMPKVRARVRRIAMTVRSGYCVRPAETMDAMQ